MTRRAEYLNEMKTRVDDEVYEAVQRFKEINFIESDSAALARLLRMCLFGIFPKPRGSVSSTAAQVGTREKA